MPDQSTEVVIYWLHLWVHLACVWGQAKSFHSPLGHGASFLSQLRPEELLPHSTGYPV